MIGLQNKIMESLEEVRNKIYELEEQQSDDYSVKNYAQELTFYYRLRRKLERMLRANRFYRISEEAFFGGVTQDKEILHKVKEYETLNSIAEFYNVKPDEILKINNIQSGKLKFGETIKIILPNNATVHPIGSDYPVFGVLRGKKILGEDIKNDFTELKSDLKILPPVESFAQGLVNRVTTVKGNYPEDESFGIDPYEGKDLDEKVRQNMIKVKVADLLQADPRIKDVTNLEIYKPGTETLMGTITVKTIDEIIEVRF